MSPSRRSNRSAQFTEITPKLLRAWALPVPSEGGDKTERGNVLTIGGSPETPGAVVLSAIGALRAGAGRLQIATGKSVAPWIAMRIPEALVVHLPELGNGSVANSGVPKLIAAAKNAHGLLIGPGMTGGSHVGTVVKKILAKVNTPTVLDAEALKAFYQTPDFLKEGRVRVVVTPHAGEMAAMMGIQKTKIEKDPLTIALEFARTAGVVTVMKGAQTFIATPGGKVFRNTAGNVGLATSGSGDCLAGIITGLLARGAELEQAAAWGVFLHATAGEVLARKIGPMGYLAREILDEIPGIMARFSSRVR